MNIRIRTPRTTGALFAAAAVLLGTAAPVAAVPGTPSAVFDQDSVSWLSLRDQSSAGFAASFHQHAKAGFLPVDIDIETPGNDYRVGSVWQRNTDGRAWRELRDLTSAGFHAAWEKARADGMRLVEQETYLFDGQRRYAGIWIQNKENLSWASYRGLTSSQFSARFADNREAGRMPVDVDRYETRAGARYNVIWAANSENLGWYLYRDMTSAQFSARFDQLSGQYRMLAFDSVQTEAGQRYAGIWVRNTDGRAWATWRDLTAGEYAAKWQHYADAGYRVVSFDRYETAAGTRYAAIWRQNS